MNTIVDPKLRQFEALALPLMNSLYHTALRLTRNEQDAQDLVQDVYLRAFRFFHRFELGTNFRAWIFRILMNNFINRYRKQKREPQGVDFDKVEFFVDADDERATESGRLREGGFTIEDLVDDEVRDALERLPREFRAVVLLADVEGLSYKEIANVLQIPIGTVMSRLSRGRRLLQKALAEYAVAQGYVSPQRAYRTEAGAYA